jgi:hypothetical protein
VAPHQQGITHFSMERGMRTLIWHRFFGHRRIISGVKRVEIVADRMLYIILGCNIDTILFNTGSFFGFISFL